MLTPPRGLPHRTLDNAVAFRAKVRRRLISLRSQPATTRRLVDSPVFVMTATRSGSTLLRVLLNSHSQIRAPQELHLNALRVHMDTAFANRAYEYLGISDEEFATMLWDRVLLGLLESSGKKIIVDKTPQYVNEWRRVHQAWPHARFIHLRRHPAAILRSRIEANSTVPLARNIELVLRYGSQLDEARAGLPGPTVRYEDLTADPESVTRELCRYLGVRWEPTMVRYQVPKRSELRSGLGDWSESIRSGVVQPARPAPDDIPDELVDLVARWGY